MASIINASITSTTGLVQTADASGILQLQSNGVTGLNINTGGKVVFPNTSLSTATAGTLEYDGTLPYFTALGLQRGVIPGQQFYRLNTDLVGTATTAAQTLFGVGCTVSSNTVYAFQMLIALTKTATGTSHTTSLSILGTGTATFNNILYRSSGINQSGDINTVDTSTEDAVSNVATSTALTSSYGIATQVQTFFINGTFSIATGGTIVPQYTTSASTGPYSTRAGSYMLLYPIGVAGANTSIGTWA
jgi:hypothetical protein